MADAFGSNSDRGNQGSDESTNPRAHVEETNEPGPSSDESTNPRAHVEETNEPGQGFAPICYTQNRPRPNAESSESLKRKLQNDDEETEREFKTRKCLTSVNVKDYAYRKYHEGLEQDNKHLNLQMIMNNEVANENEKVLLDRIKDLEEDQKNFRKSTEERFNRIWAMCNRVKCVICKCTFNSSNKRAIIHPMGRSICEECANPTTLGNAQDLLDTSLDDQVQNEARLFANSALNNLIKDLESEHRNHSGQNV